MELGRDGIETLQVIHQDDLNDIQHSFSHMEASFPEFTINARPLVLGGFAAYGNPSSFHNPFVKHLRKQCLKTVMDNGIFTRFLRDMNIGHTDYKVEVLFDRILHRFQGQKPVSETAHRDITPHSELHDGDYVFGGWLNLSNTDQHFMCKPGSHLDTKDTKTASESSSGFNTLSKESTQTEYMPFRKEFTVKPGHLILFPQHILHEVLSNKSKHTQYRLFIGWRLTKSKTLIFEQQKKQAIRDLSVPVLPSGQTPPMYSANHASVFKNKPFNYISTTAVPRGTLIHWLETSFVDTVKEKFVNGTMYKRSMLSLKEYGLHDGYEYSEEDERIMLSLHAMRYGL